MKHFKIINKNQKFNMTSYIVKYHHNKYLNIFNIFFNIQFVTNFITHK